MAEAGAGPTERILKGPIQLKELGLKDGVVGAFLGTLSDGGRGVTDPCPTTGGEPGGSTEGV